LKLNGTQLLVYAANVNILGGRVLTVKKTDSKKNDLEMNTEKTKYMVMSRDQNAGQNGKVVRKVKNVLP
jgi:hypothetical protein